MLHTQVLISGAGPTGLMLACQLARYGIDFRVVDARSGPRQEPRALGVQARTLELFEALGIADLAVHEGRPVAVGNLHVNGRRVQRIAFGEMGCGHTPFPFLLILEQGRMERLLHRTLQQCARDVEWACVLDGQEPDEDRIVARLRHADGREETLSAEWLVACDGAASPVRQGLGLAFAGGDYEQPFYVADTHVDWDLPHGELMVCLSPETFVVFFPLPGEQRYRVVGILPGQAGREPGLRFEDVEAAVRAQLDAHVQLSGATWLSDYPVHHRCVERFRIGRILLAGDAAHVHSPIGAQGMNTGLQDACNLAWKLALVAQGRAEATLLDSYHEERWALAQGLLETTDRALRLIIGRQPLLRAFRVGVFPWLVAGLVKRQRIFPILSQIGAHYCNSPLSQSVTKLRVAAGERLPYVEIRPSPDAGALSIYRWLESPGFHLFLLQRDEAGLETLAAFWTSCLAKSHPGWFHVHALAEHAGTQALFEALGVADRALVLVRPDQYIAYTDRHFDLPALGTYLDDVLGLIVEGEGVV